MRIGVVSDTHAWPHRGLFEWLSEVEHIIHAGDVGDDRVLTYLESLAPVTAVRGNVDRTGKPSYLPEVARVNLSGLRLMVTHAISSRPAAQGELVRKIAADIDVLVFGHSHRPQIVKRNGVLLLNPGSAGPRRFDLPVSAATIDLSERRVTIADIASNGFDTVETWNLDESLGTESS
ncbi:MAG: metallophosphoesterase family protein [Candidatus Latescibacteria bacterium]|nr:metallophosphoesterase family protein [Candidatus Latescibacterota bacterium]